MAAQFLSAFNDVENHLREQLRCEAHVTMSELSRRGQEKHLVTLAQGRDLSALTNLRNALTHGRYYGGRALAEPVSEIVAAMERLRDQLLRPARARDVLKWAPPVTFAPHDLLSSVLALAAEQRYSQFPVYHPDHGYAGLLTTDGVAMWLGANLTASDVGLIEDVRVDRVLPHDEQRDAAVFVPEDITAQDAIYRLQQGGPQGRPAAALLVTRSGRRHERFLALITSADLPPLVDAAG